jgi:chaperonin GroES
MSASHIFEGEEMPGFTPIQDRVLVKRVDSMTKSPGGIFIPDAAQEQQVEGVVIAVGNGKVLPDGTRRPLDIHAGDKVIFNQYGGQDIEIEGVVHVIMREDDIVGTVHA